VLNKTIMGSLISASIIAGPTVARTCEEGDIACRQGARLYCVCETLTLGSRERTCRWEYRGGRCTSFETPIPDGQDNGAQNLLFRVTHRQQLDDSR
jgi:hypothetical protein